jgi:predicted enzyme related to lactoylglutathione lyase
MTTTNAINWFEIPVSNLQNAIAFYAKVTGQKVELLDHPTIPHAIFGSGPGVSGALIVDPSRTPGATGVVIYLDVRDGVQAAVDRAREAGGKIVQPLTDLGEHGTFALIHDRDGNLIGLHTAKAGA